MTIAFFDLDKTLLSKNSAELWLKHLYKTGQIRLPEMIKSYYWILKYHFGFTRMADVIEKSILLIRGESEETLKIETKKFFLNQIKATYRPGARDALGFHKNSGHKTALLTSSLEGLSQLVQSDLDLDYCLSTRLEVDSAGFFTGKTIGMPCFGQSKVHYAKQLCNDLNISLDECIFYTDSASDIPLLELVGKPVCVNPDPHLRAKAKLKNWQIVDWGKPQNEPSIK